MLNDAESNSMDEFIDKMKEEMKKQIDTYSDIIGATNNEKTKAFWRGKIAEVMDIKYTMERVKKGMQSGSIG